MNVLVVAVHPDDESLGCGGTISRMAKEGHNVFITILGEGVTSRYDKREDADERIIRRLHKESYQVAEFLGAKDLFIHNYPDNQFDTVPLLEIVKTIEKVVDKTKPCIVFTQHGGDLNIDHAITFRATMTAIRPLKNCPVKEFCAFEVPSSTEWAFNRFASGFKPNLFFDISKTLDMKIQAMELYMDEIQPFPHPRSAESLRITAQRWGSVIGIEYAEAFELIRSTR